MADSTDTNKNQSNLHRERGTTAYINTSHITHNLNVFKQLHAGKIIAVVKADAYGHGLKHVVPALAACDAFAVATIEEALELRDLEANKRILLLEGVFNSYEMNMAIEKQFDVVIHQDYQIKLLESADKTAELDVWLKVDSGMNRLGFQVVEVNDKLTQINAIDGIATVRLMSHFATSNLAD
ncbi:Alanine racemase, partial [hydrothermal vent metagenome]